MRRFGQILIVDLPGLGGMDSFYKIGKKPTLDNYAHFLHKFLEKKLPKQQKFCLLGFSLGLMISSRLLSIYPQYQPRLKALVSVVGFLRGADLKFSRQRRFFYLLAASLVKIRPGALFFRYVIINKLFLKMFYARTALAKAKFQNISAQRKKELIAMETELWHINDVRTWAYTAELMLKVNLSDLRLKVQLYHAYIEGDQFLNNDSNHRILKNVYNKVKCFGVNLGAHAPTVIADEAEAELFIPQGLSRVLAKL